MVDIHGPAAPTAAAPRVQAPPPLEPPPHTSIRFALTMLIVVLIGVGLSAINPPHPADFAIEHILTAIFVIVLVATWKIFPLSRRSYALITAFLLLHALGSHYTYSEVPYDAWSTRIGAWFGAAEFSLDRLLGFERNQFDRLVHFAFGVLLVHPIRELFARLNTISGAWASFSAINAVLAYSLVYECLEWGVALIMSEGVGQSYLGTQGDVWDAQKDMALAGVGAVMAIGFGWVRARFITRKSYRKS